MQSVYSTAPADWAMGHSLWQSYPSAEIQSVYSIVPVEWTNIRGIFVNNTKILYSTNCKKHSKYFIPFLWNKKRTSHLKNLFILKLQWLNISDIDVQFLSPGDSKTRSSDGEYYVFKSVVKDHAFKSDVNGMRWTLSFKIFTGHIKQLIIYCVVTLTSTTMTSKSQTYLYLDCNIRDFG